MKGSAMGNPPIIDRKTAVEKINKLIANLNTVIKDKEEVIRLTLAGFLARGHILYDDIPGTGKSILAESLARSVSAGESGIAVFKRIQGTPDLMPGDVTGISIYNPETKEFEPKLGPIATGNIVLDDELNRTPPKVNSAVLEAMSRETVTIDGISYNVPKPYLVIATQNPIEQEGTFVLPEALLDRFMLRLSLGYPSKEAELEILASQRNHHPIHDLRPVISCDEILHIQQALTINPSEDGFIYMHRLIEEYIVAIIDATRKEVAKEKSERMLDYGASTRGTLALRDAARAYAFMNDRDYVIPQDIRALTVPVLAHRVGVNMRVVRSGNENKTAEEAIKRIVASVATPSEQNWTEPQIKF